MALFIRSISNVYRYLNINPGRNDTIDCTIRAVSLALDQSWEKTFIHIMVECLIHHDMPEANYIWAGYLRRRGYKRHLIPDTCPLCYTVRDFCADHKRGRYILGTGSHAVTVIDGDYFDTFDSGDYVPIYYWEKEI